MRSVTLLFGLFFAFALSEAVAADWTMDRATSRLEFFATFEKTAAPGVFAAFDTRVRFDADKLPESRIDVTITVTSADMMSADVNKAIRGAEWFDFQHFPQAEFHATDIRRTEGNKYVARGTLSLKGVSQTIEVPFRWSESANGATMDGEVTIKRTQFGIGVGEWAATNVIGADVRVKFNVGLRKGT